MQIRAHWHGQCVTPLATPDEEDTTVRLNDMVGGWMTDNPVTLAPDRPVIEAYALMAEHEIRHIPVVDGGRLLGIVSDRDLHRASPLGKARSPGDIAHLFTMPVAEIMTRSHLRTVDPLVTISAAAAIFVATKVSALPVIEGDRLVGILTTHDVLRAVMGHPKEQPRARAS